MVRRTLALLVLLVASTARADVTTADLLAALEHEHEAFTSLRVLLDDETAADPHARDPRSVDSAPHGALQAGVQLGAHPAYVVRDPLRAWATAETVTQLTSAFDEVMRADPHAPRVRVHDLSLQNGGPMPGHRSHRTGLDADITYYHRTCRGECSARSVSARELDAVRQWRLLRHWLQQRQAEFVFIDYALQRPLYEEAKASGSTRSQLANWLQYPRGQDFRGGVVRHFPNHANHLHVRFRSASQDHVCAETTQHASAGPPRDEASYGSEFIETEVETKELLDLLD